MAVLANTQVTALRRDVNKYRTATKLGWHRVAFQARLGCATNRPRARQRPEWDMIRPRPLLIPLFTVASCALASCATQDQKDRMESGLTSSVGRSIADFALEHGPPRSSANLGANRRSFEWIIAGQPTGSTMPITGFPISPQQLSCTVSLTAATTKASPELSDWKIESWHWNGNC